MKISTEGNQQWLVHALSTHLTLNVSELVVLFSVIFCSDALLIFPEAELDIIEAWVHQERSILFQQMQP